MITGWLVKIALGIAVAGVLVYDAGAIAVNFFGLDSTATDVANELSSAVGDGDVDPHNQHELQRAARRYARPRGARVAGASYDTENQAIRVRLRREADTLIVGRVGLVEDWGKATADGRAVTP